MALAPGQNLLHYHLVGRIGQGGMGEVWRATDTSLGRDVAVKLLPAVFSGDPERLARLEREAKLLASLNHPHIATVFGLHDAGGVRFIAMEFVAGEDLAARMARGPIPQTRRAPSPVRSPTRWSRPTKAAWSTATSSLRT